MENLEIHTDGGSRGNPGPAASAFVVEENKKVIHKGSFFLGNATNNFAEYSAVILALKWFVSKEFKNAEFLLDSELVVRQLNGLYKIKNPDLQKLNQEIKEIIDKNNLEIIFKNVLRDKNKIADQLVNEELDRNL